MLFRSYLRENGRDTVLVDPNPLTPDGSVSATLMGISQDGKLLAYGLRKGGAVIPGFERPEDILAGRIRAEGGRGAAAAFVVRVDSV